MTRPPETRTKHRSLSAGSLIHKGGPSQAPRRDFRWLCEEGACWWHATDERNRMESQEQVWRRETL